MLSKVRILPSDVLLLIIDYLDSPSMMNCREVCKSWLEIVDSSASLWTYFYDPSLTDTDTTSNMLKLFSIKSHDSLKAFSVIQGESKRQEVRPGTTQEDVIRAGWAKECQDAKTIVDILLRSKESLRLLVFSDNSYTMSLVEKTFEESAQFPNLKSISFKLTHFQGHRDQRAKVRIRRIPVIGDARQLNTASKTSLTELLIQDPWGRMSSQLLATLIKSCQSTLLHLRARGERMEDEKMTFDRLQVLEMPLYMNKFPSSWHCPSLRVLILSLPNHPWPFRHTTVDCFPPSVEYHWLMKALMNIEPTLEKGGLENLKKGNPGLEVLRIDSDVNFIPKEVVEMVEARRRAAKRGVEGEGLKMRSMKQLILDFSRLDSPTLSKLQELVPEVIDVRTVSNELIIDCEVSAV